MMIPALFTPALEGFATSAGLIIAIGVQNAFVLKQGILKNQVLISVLTCCLLDAMMISLGIAGVGHIFAMNPVFMKLALWGGVLFLTYYGIRSFRSVFHTESLAIGSTQGKQQGFYESMLTAVVVSVLNPHAVLDTVVLLGSISAQFEEHERLYFAIGAISASFLWFCSLGFGARFLAPVFQKPLSWKILDLVIGCVMWGIAASLVYHAFTLEH